MSGPIHCTFCGRPIRLLAIQIGNGMYHEECTHGPGYIAPTFAPIPLSADDVRRLVREELARLARNQSESA